MSTVEQTDLNEIRNLQELYLTIDPKYFSLNKNDRYYISLYDINNDPQLLDFIQLSGLENELFDFTDFPFEIKEKISLIYYRNFGVTVRLRNEIYINKDKLIEIDPDNNEVIQLLNLLDKDFYYNFDNTSPYIKYRLLNDYQKTLIMDLFFFNKDKLLMDKKFYIKYMENLTDIDIGTNKYIVETDIKRFFLNIFFSWINTSQGAIPFSSGYYCSIKDLIQVKNLEVLFNYLKNEFETFFNDISTVYGTSINLVSLKIDSTDNITGSDVITIDIKITFEDKPIQFSIQI